MKKVVLPLALFCLATAGMRAQDNESTSGASEFNKWSIELGAGVNKTANPFDTGYHMKTLNFFDANLGFRYMFNTKFGLKVEGYYDSFKESDESVAAFDSKVVGVSLQGVANLGRIMEFESWTKSINVLGHMGVGVSWFTNDPLIEGDMTDQLGNFLIGLTAQLRLSNRIALTGDITMINNFSQQRTWNGGYIETGGQYSQGFDSTIYHGTIGLNIYLGGQEQHADWYVDEKSDELEEAESRIDELEAKMQDTDRDGVPDYLDAEPNTTSGVAVDTKGRSIDKNNNGIPDELESVTQRIDQVEKNAVTAGKSEGLKEMINGGYVNVYFDFNKDTPNAQSVSGINFLIKYLKENPSASSDVIGYADEIGDTAYNNDLSKRRAENVKKILVDAGIEASRLNIVGNGEDASVNKNSKQARQTVRRVTFQLK